MSATVWRAEGLWRLARITAFFNRSASEWPSGNRRNAAALD
jgi:hypothetical protein